MLGWFQALMPREEQFYPLFIQHSELIVTCAEALDRLLKNGSDAERYCQEIRQREQNADDITREVHLAVRRTFITPFDRGDIRDLINAMDDAVDEMHHTAQAVALFEVRAFRPTMQACWQRHTRSASRSCDAARRMRALLFGRELALIVNRSLPTPSRRCTIRSARTSA